MGSGELVGMRIDVGVDWFDDRFGEILPQDFVLGVELFYEERLGVDVEFNWVDPPDKRSNEMWFVALVDDNDDDPPQEVADRSLEFDQYAEASIDDPVWDPDEYKE